MATEMSETRRCKLCDRPLVFAPGPKGSTIPLERIRNVYALGSDGQAIALFAGRVPLHFYVSHFETCPNASELSRGKRKSGGT